MILTARTWFFLGFLACLSMMLIALYFQYVVGLEPCPLCITQRVGTILVGLIFLIAALHHPGRTGTRVYAVTGFVVAMLGAAVSIRHLYIQSLPPDQVPACGPGLAYVFEYFPLTETIKLLFSGTGECAEVLWSFLGLSIPGWTLVAFIGLGVLSLAQFWNPRT